MEDGHISKDDLCDELASGARRLLVQDRPALRFRDACKRDIKSAHIIIESKEIWCNRSQQLATGCAEWCEEGRRKKKRNVDGE